MGYVLKLTAVALFGALAVGSIAACGVSGLIFTAGAACIGTCTAASASALVSTELDNELDAGMRDMVQAGILNEMVNRGYAEVRDGQLFLLDN